MLGKMIDRLALTALGAAGLYCFYLYSGFGVPLSGVLAFVSVALIKYLIERRPRRARATAAQAEAALKAIAMLPEAEALAALRRLTGRAAFCPLIRHPDASVSAGELFALWRAHMGEGELAIVATCAIEPEAKALAGELQNPRVVIADRKALVKVIRASGWHVPEAPRPEPLHRRMGKWLARLPRAARVQTALYGVSMLGMYLLTGRALCLAAGLGLIGAVGISFINNTICAQNIRDAL